MVFFSAAITFHILTSVSLSPPISKWFCSSFFINALVYDLPRDVSINIVSDFKACSAYLSASTVYFCELQQQLVTKCNM